MYQVSVSWYNLEVSYPTLVLVNTIVWCWLRTNRCWFVIECLTKAISITLNTEQLLPSKGCLCLELQASQCYWQETFDDWTLLVSSLSSFVGRRCLLLLLVVVVTLSQWKMEVDEALGQLGIGRWQILHFTTISVACWTTSCFHMLAIIYIGRPKY